MSTRYYLDSKWPDLTPTQPSIKKVVEEVSEVNEIDEDIEKQIRQLQEARIAGELEKPEQLSIDPIKQLNEWHLEKGLKAFLSNVEFEKEDLNKKIKEEDAKISALEELFGGLIEQSETEKSIEVKNNELSEEEKKERAQARLNVLSELFEKKIIKEKVEEKIEENEILEEEPEQKLTIDYDLERPKVEIDEKTLEAQKLVEQKYGQAGSLAFQGLINASVKDIEADPQMVDKVLKHISEMKVANELDKDKMRSLRSIDSLEKLTKEFLRFKNITSVQLSTLGGGGSTRILDNDDVDISSIGNGKILEYNSTTKKMQFVASGDSVTNLEVLGTIIFEGATADAYETTLNVVDPTADRTITLPNISGTLPVLAAASATQITSTPEELNYVDGVTGNIQTALDAKATKAFAIAQAVALG